MVLLPFGRCDGPVLDRFCASAWRAWDAGLNADSIATTYEVSRAWVYRLMQRRRETGSVAPREQTTFRRRTLSADEEDRLVALMMARPDATVAELQQALPTAAALSTIGRRGLTVKKMRMSR